MINILLVIVLWLACFVVSYIFGRLLAYFYEIFVVRSRSMWTKGDRFNMLFVCLVFAPITVFIFAFLIIFVLIIKCITCLGTNQGKARW